ncbi:ribosomal RNA large subunit methyltransferase J [Gemmobacter lanyuensis]|uniref:Ribosomal RNA large subunit methyltransferase J n=2 Tax=Gemmobacter lanyuensis TaxID=1054497 RepID=A0A918IXC1_9RHOB|nr:ribosomal RNA large subunit methyltransferase J [Gemmobacter lanyuensis]
MTQQAERSYFIAWRGEGDYGWAMLSYQHIYHAGNLADVQKHALLCHVLDYMTQKDKPLTYIETHAGRGLYDLSSHEAEKTGEAAGGISVLERKLRPSHPYRKRLAEVRARHGASAYPGSPLLAVLSLRPTDQIHLSELHPQEHHGLYLSMADFPVHLYQRDGLQQALALTPPTPRRGVMLIDPSYEIKDDYVTIPKLFAAVGRKWNVGVLMLWYPILTSGAHLEMLATMEENHPDHLRHEVRFPPVREGHRMIGSGMFIVNPPWGTAEAAAEITDLFKKL